jgi:hypothetical protein
MLSQMLADYAAANAEGKQDMFEEAAERMITAEKAVTAMRERLTELNELVKHHREHHENEARLQAVEAAASDVAKNWFSNKREVVWSMNNLLAALERKTT